ncbi:MAG: hypothetical protein R6V05_03435 [Candidatus Brocadiia bacterium]
MSENITHTAVVDDCRRLALSWPAICAPFKEALRHHHDTTRLGGLTRWGDRFTVELLGRYAETWEKGDGKERAGARLAFVLGWLCHRAADRQMKPVFRAADPDCEESPTDCSIYHDVFLFLEVYGSGAEEPYSPATLEAPLESLSAGDVRAADVEELLRAVLQRALLGLHTLKPDARDIEGWLDGLLDLRQEYRVSIPRYAKALAEPDAGKVRRFIEEVNFYDPADPLIRLARSIQRNGPADVPMEEALEAAGGGSHYARALRRGCRYLQTGSEYFTGRITEEEGRERLDIGLPDY